MAEIDQSNAKNALDSLLNYLNAPWKVIAIAFLGILGFGGYMIHQNASFLFAAYQQNKSLPKLDVSKSDEMAALIFKNTEANLIVFFRVDLMLGERIIDRAYSRDAGRVKTFDGVNVGMLSDDAANNVDLMNMYAGKIIYSSYTKPQSLIGFWYIAEGSTFFFRSSIPVKAGLFIGQLSIGFKEAPQDFSHVEGIMAVVANEMVKR